MNKEIAELQMILGRKELTPSITLQRKIALFKEKYGLIIPADLVAYFALTENGLSDFEKDLYKFYRFGDFKSVREELQAWKGIPDYSNIVNTLPASETCFVFADYMMHSFAYAIRLHQSAVGENEIYVICGDKYKKIAGSFSGFLMLYFSDPQALEGI